MSKITARTKTGQIAKGSNLRHGMSDAPEYDCWIAMKARCYKPWHPNYKHYGGRGITVCQYWLESFDNFISDMGLRPDGMTLDRIDNNKGYYKENCRWVSIGKQQLNRSNNNVHPGVCYEADRDSYNVRITVKGKRINLGRYKSLYKAMDVRIQAEEKYGI